MMFPRWIDIELKLKASNEERRAFGRLDKFMDDRRNCDGPDNDHLSSVFCFLCKYCLCVTNHKLGNFCDHRDTCLLKLTDAKKNCETVQCLKLFNRDSWQSAKKIARNINDSNASGECYLNVGQCCTGWCCFFLLRSSNGEFCGGSSNELVVTL